MNTGSRQKKNSILQKISAFAMAHDLTAYIIPGADIARANNLDIEASGLKIVASPRHASVLVIIGSLSPELSDAAAVIYAQMARPRAILSLGGEAVSTLPPASISAEPSAEGLADAVIKLREWFGQNAFSENVEDFEASALSTRIEYVCPMHPEIVQDEPGSCPKCGMFLVKREVQANNDTPTSHEHKHHAHSAKHEHHKSAKTIEETTETTGKYTCPMHPEIIQDEPGSCPKCGMNLVPMDEAANAEETHDCCKSETETAAKHEHKVHDHKSHEHHHDNAETTGKYTCPMHPEIIQDEPGSCPKCGMNLVPMDDAAAKHEHKHANHDHSTMSHEGMDHSTMDHDDFMSMVDVTKDLPRSEDGLPMEWVDSAFGPFFPGLPSGLILSLTLDGDAIAKTKISTGMPLTPLLDHTETAFNDFVDRLTQLNPMAPVSYRLLACMALENATDASVSRQVAHGRMGALEQERIASHLNWLTDFGLQSGYGWLQNSAADLQLKVQQAGLEELLSLKTGLAKLINRIRNTPLLKARTHNIGILPGNKPMTGPVARANGSDHDARNLYQIWSETGFIPLSGAGNDIFARLDLRLDEIFQSLQIIEKMDEIAMPQLAELPDSSSVPLIGQASVETPRGLARLHVTVQDGSVIEARLQTPSMLHTELIAPMIEEMELGDALMAVQSLDISPWEISS